MDLWTVDRGSAAFDLPQRGQRFSFQARRIDAFTSGQVGGQFADGFAQLAARTQRISPAVVMEGYRDVNQRLEKKAARSPLSGPFLLPYLVGFEETAVIEEANSALE